MSARANLLWPMLGGVRFLLAFIVAATHLTWFAPGNNFERVLGSLSAVAAVVGFLVISGFSIAASLQRERSGYFARRALRIVPLYLFSLGASWACVHIWGGRTLIIGSSFALPSWSDGLQNVFFLQGFTCPSFPANPVVWTLSIEVFFYLLAPLLWRLSTGALATITAVSAGFFIAGRFVYTPYYGVMEHGMAAAFLGWAWLAGFLVYRIRNRMIAAVIVGAVSIGVIALHPLYFSRLWWVTLLLVGAALAIGGKLTAPPAVGRVLTALGDASFALYLFHIPVYIALFGSARGSPAIAYVLAAVAASFGVDLLFDKPVKRAIRWLCRPRDILPLPIPTASP